MWQNNHYSYYVTHQIYLQWFYMVFYFCMIIWVEEIIINNITMRISHPIINCIKFFINKNMICICLKCTKTFLPSLCKANEFFIKRNNFKVFDLNKWLLKKSIPQWYWKPKSSLLIWVSLIASYASHIKFYYLK